MFRLRGRAGAGEHMDCGFETIGNATVICHDREPVICTDPWLTGTAYFGSWTLSHQVPPRQMEAAKACRYIWLSHGHPDHLSLDSLEPMRDKTVLLPDHLGGRIRSDLLQQKFNVRILPDRTWTQLSPRIRVLTIADYNQDGILLIDMNGTLLVNLNDASDRGWGLLVRRMLKSYARSFLLALVGYGDAGMINVFDESGARIPPQAARRNPVGAKIAQLVRRYPARYFVPFSSMHRYQREDSIWADPYSTRLHDYSLGFASPTCELLPAFIHYDVLADRLERIDPPETVVTPVPASAFGDDWSERLEAGEKARLEAQFKAVEHLGEVLDFVEFKVGGESHVVSFRKGRQHRGITFEVPRHSLMTAIEYCVFDDLLIGNFMKTTCHGGWRPPDMDVDFTPYVAKYSDNGRARTREDLRRYMAEYRRRDPIGFLHQAIERGVVRPAHEVASRFLRERIGEDSRLFRAAKLTYRSISEAA
jgi:hypothetical protein